MRMVSDELERREHKLFYIYLNKCSKDYIYMHVCGYGLESVLH